MLLHSKVDKDKGEAVTWVMVTRNGNKDNNEEAGNIDVFDSLKFFSCVSCGLLLMSLQSYMTRKIFIF